MLTRLNVCNKKPIIIGVAGGSGSGKTYFAKKLKNTFDATASLTVTIISQDWYFKDLLALTEDEKACHNFDHPGSLDVALLKKHLQQLAAGKSIKCPQYDFSTSSRTSKTIVIIPADVYIVEGILLFSILDTSLFTKSFFIDAPEEIRLNRRIARDVAERGQTKESVLNQFYATVKPMHDTFVEPSKLKPNVVILSGTNQQQQLYDTIVAEIIQLHKARCCSINKNTGEDKTNK